MIRLQGVERHFLLGEQSVHALAQIELTIGSGEYVAVMGPSGSGKSTLLNVLGLLDRPDSGHYLLDGTDTATLDESELARLRGQQFSYSGVRLPLPVSLHVRDMTFADALRLTEAQTAWRAVLSQSAGRLHLSYMPTEKK